MKKKKTYVSPVTERVGLKAQAALLHTSQGQWADAKPDNPYGGGGGNIWSDGLWSDDEPTTDGEDTNWAGYKKDMSLW